MNLLSATSPQCATDPPEYAGRKQTTGTEPQFYTALLLRSTEQTPMLQITKNTISLGLSSLPIKWGKHHRIIPANICEC